MRAENAALRQLKAAHAPTESGAGPTLGATADDEKVAELAARLQERKAQAARKAAAEVAAKSGKPVLQNRGMGAPAEAIETFSWACYTNDLAAIARQIHFDGNGRRMAEAKLAEMPAYLKNEFKTPEELYAFFTAADGLVYPPPSDPEMLKHAQIVFLKSDRIAARRPGATTGGQEFQWTADGWKRAYPEQAIDDLANQVLRMNPMPQGE